MIVDRSEIGDAEYLYGKTNKDFAELKYLGHLQAYYRKINWGEELLTELMKEHFMERDLFRCSEVMKAIKWNKERINEMKLGDEDEVE